MYDIKIKNLTKMFDDFTAVNRISLSVKRGELFGLLGPNGAGKTTTINMLSTLLAPTSGTAKVAGYDIINEKNQVRKSIGVVFQDPALDTKLTGRENLEFHAMMYNIKSNERKRRIKEVLELVELTEKADILVENYSGGMKRRLEIARGLVHKPKVLFLDEPTLGLDAQTRRHIWDYIKKLNKEEKVTIILTTHYMEEADYLCDRVGIIDHGRIVTLDSPDDLKDRLGGDIITLEMERVSNNFVNSVSKLKFVKSTNIHNKKLIIAVKHGEKRIPDLINMALKSKVKINSVNLHKPSLEDVFLHFTGKTIREEESSHADRFREFARRRIRR